jgi:hypothetical protein
VNGGIFSIKNKTIKVPSKYCAVGILWVLAGLLTALLSNDLTYSQLRLFQKQLVFC